MKRANSRDLSEGTYTEKHHIYPKSIYGENKDLVKLTERKLSEKHKNNIKSTLLSGIGGFNNKNHTAETKHKISLAKKGIKISDEHKLKISKAVQQFDLNYNLLKEFNSIADTYRETHICNISQGKKKLANGFIWKYKNKFNKW